MYKTPEIEKEKPRCGKENFKGFCIDLAEKIAADLKFNYNICLVSDGKYGERLNNGTWNGVIGELTKNVGKKDFNRFCSALENPHIFSVMPLE